MQEQISYMTGLETIQHSISSELKMLNDSIRQSLHTSNSLMNDVVERYLETKGKQIRPLLVMLSAKLFGSIDDKVISAAASVELLHNASLIHDDVVDDTQLRRNRPTINAVWDNRIAVLVGDFFVSTSLHRAVETGDMRIINAIGELGRTLSLGEIDQIQVARKHIVDESCYLDIIDSKTASLFVTCVKLGGYAINAPDEDIERLARFAHLFGLCFQIRDDIFDYYEDSNVGKPTGNDLREGKITLPLLYALGLADHPEHKRMVELVKNDELTTEQIDMLINFAKDNGGIDYAYERMHNLREEAVDIISYFPDSDTRRAFISIFDYIISRDK